MENSSKETIFWEYREKGMFASATYVCSIVTNEKNKSSRE